MTYPRSIIVFVVCFLLMFVVCIVLVKKHGVLTVKYQRVNNVLTYDILAHASLTSRACRSLHQ